MRRDAGVQAASQNCGRPAADKIEFARTGEFDTQPAGPSHQTSRRYVHEQEDFSPGTAVRFRGVETVPTHNAL